jgi:hypothetical protein
MSVSHVVVDGSNLATEGRTLPSLAQLDEAVRAFVDQYEPGTVTVVVDASFPNRIEDAERAAYEEAVTAGEVITPPAGVIGRGDAFLLEVADRAGAVVLSNDSFQEFHGQYTWLFEQGRLIGGKPVPHVGWVFMDRAPVRGPVSRKAVSEAKKAAKRKAAAAAPSAALGAAKRAKGTKGAQAAQAAASEAAEPARSGTPSRRSRRRRAGTGSGAAEQAPELVPAAASAGPESGSKEGSKDGAPQESGGRRRRRRGGGGGSEAAPETTSVEPYNEPLPFIDFVAAHPVGAEVEGTVERFSSHGAYVLAGGARCYVALKHLADPPPRSAREVLDPGGTYTFVVQAFDTPRRGVDLAMPGVVAAPEPSPAPVPEAEGTAAPEQPIEPTEEAQVAAATKKATRKAATKKAGAKKGATKKAPAKRAPAKKAATKKAATKKAGAKKAATKKAPAKRAPAKKAPAKKAGAKRAPAKKAPAKKAAAKKAPAKRAPARKAARKRS